MKHGQKNIKYNNERGLMDGWRFSRICGKWVFCVDALLFITATKFS